MLKNKLRGFTFIEALVLLFVFSLVTVTFYNVISLGTRYIIISKNRLNAVAIANEKMEIIRNLRYEDVGTVGGACEGNIPQEEDVLRDGKSFHVYTLAKFEDDPFDGSLGGSPNDSAFKDYKTVKVKVSWNNGGSDNGEISLSSRFAPQGLEVASAGDGILSINIFSDQDGGVGVSQANVHIVNNDVGMNQTIQTDNSGNVMLVGAKESIQNYQITVTKSDYETVTTFPAYPNTAYNPIDTHASVIEGTLNITNIVQNKVADLKIVAKDYLGNPVSGVDFDLVGGRKLGTEDAFPYDPIYNLNVSDETEADGEMEYNSISPGQYSFELSSSESDYALVGIDTISPFSLVSEDSMEINLIVADKNAIGFSTKILNNIDSSPVSGAEVRLKNDILGYDQSTTVGDDGMAFFPKEEGVPILAGTYDLFVTMDGFQNHNESVEINDGALLINTVNLMPDA